MSRIYDYASDLPAPTSEPVRPAPTQILMGDPAEFDVTYVINPHMAEHVGNVDKAAAREQWAALKAAYESIGFEVIVLPPAPGLPDLVFVANQSFPWKDEKGRLAILSRMRNEERRPEVAVLEQWYQSRGNRTDHLPGDGFLEGHGDLRWHPGHRFLYGGHGFRTNGATLAVLSEHTGIPVARLKLVDDKLYHLDTCFSPLSSTTALVVREAFSEPTFELLSNCFENLLEVPYEEAVEGLSANGHSPDGKHFLVHTGSPRTRAMVEAAGLKVIETDTTEFLKSGGSVYCMTLMLP